MTRLFTLVLGALLALVSLVHAKTTKMNQVRLYEFPNNECVGFHKHANVDLEEGKCFKIRGESFKVMMDLKRMDWLNAVNNGTWTCRVTYFAEDDCLKPYYSETIPNGINDCMKDGTPCQDEYPACPYNVDCLEMKSAKFWCIEHSVTAVTAHEVTSWSINRKNELPTPYSSTTIATCTFTFAPSGPKLTDNPNREEAYVWMYEPWSRTVMCYFCHTKHKDDYSWVKCEGRADNRRMCQGAPVDASGSPTPTYVTESPTTVIETAIVTLTEIDETTTTQVVTTQYPYMPLQADLEPRGSWHHAISFNNPFAGGPKRFCGDIEHEKRGKKGKEEYRIQKVHAITEKNPCDGSYYLDLEPEVVHEPATTVTSIVTDFEEETYYATVVETSTKHTMLMAPRSEEAEAEAEAVHTDL